LKGRYPFPEFLRLAENVMLIPCVILFRCFAWYKHPFEAALMGRLRKFAETIDESTLLSMAN
jgi:hypothetical protein